MGKQNDTLKIHSDPKNVANVEPFVENVFKKYRLSPEKYGNILISLTEAVTNAIVHGNDRDHSKIVLVFAKKTNKNLSFTISDEGQGFDFDNLPDPTAPENLLKVGGRGVFLIHQLSDEVQFHDNGSTLEIHFNL